MLPPWRWAYARPLVGSLWRALAKTVTLYQASPGALHTSPSLFDLTDSLPLALGRVSASKALTATPTILVMGWTYAPSGTIRLSGLSDAGAGSTEAALTVTNDPGIIPVIGRSTGTAARFQWRSRCAPECRLSVTLEDAAGPVSLFERQASALHPGTVTTLGSGVLLYIDSMRVEASGERLTDLPLVVAGAVAWAMRLVSPLAVPLAMLGALALLAADILRRRMRPVTVLASVLLLALLARLAVIALADATTVPALEFRFLAPGMMLCWALVGVVGAAVARSK
jgi:hypothetical protein